MRSPTASTPRATGGRGVRYARRPRLTLCSHDCHCTSRKLSVHAIALCALCPPLYCPDATNPRQAFIQSSYLTLSGCQLSSQGGPGVRLARHRRRRQARYARTIVNADFCSEDLNVRRCRCRHRCSSGKWLVGPCRTSNRATSFFIRLGSN